MIFSGNANAGAAPGERAADFEINRKLTINEKLSNAKFKIHHRLFFLDKRVENNKNREPF